MLSAKTIAKNAVIRHGLRINAADDQIHGLIRYVLNIGYNEGWTEQQKEKKRGEEQLEKMVGEAIRLWVIKHGPMSAKERMKEWGMTKKQYVREYRKLLRIKLEGLRIEYDGREFLDSYRMTLKRGIDLLERELKLPTLKPSSL